MKLLKKQNLTSVLGLSFDAGHLEGALVKRTNGTVTILKLFTSHIVIRSYQRTGTGWPGDSKYFGESRDSEKRCAVCLPLNWALTLQTKVPDLGEGDLESLLVLEAERGFPYRS